MRNKLAFRTLSVCFVLIWSFYWLGAVGAAQWRVNTAADPADWDENDGTLSLREAISRAEPGDFVTFHLGLKGRTIVLANGDITIESPITIDASDLYDKKKNAPGVTIDAAGRSRVFYSRAKLNGESARIVGLNFVGGRDENNLGGAIYNTDNLVVSTCWFVENYSDGGGAIYNGGNLEVVDCAFDKNGARGNGGAIDNRGTASVASTAFNENRSSDRGGAIYNQGRLTVFDAAFRKNVVRKHGGFGGAISSFSGEVAVERSSFIENRAGDDFGGLGGAIYSLSSLSVERSTFYRNAVGGSRDAAKERVDDCDGGAIYCGKDSSILNATFSENEATCGGAVYNAGSASVVNSTFSGNVATRRGGAIYNGRAVLVANATLTQNSAEDGGALYGSGVFVNVLSVGNLATTGRDAPTNKRRTFYSYYSALGSLDGDGENGDAENAEKLFAQTVETSFGLAPDAVFKSPKLQNGVVETKDDVDAATRGTLVGRRGDDWFYLDKTDDVWRRVGDDENEEAEATEEETEPEPDAFDAERKDFGLRGGFVCLKAQNFDATGAAVSRTQNLEARRFEIGAFAATDKLAPLKSMKIRGAVKVGSTLKATLSPKDATATFQWFRVGESGEETAITDATEPTYEITDEDAGAFLKATAVGSGLYRGSVDARTKASVPASESVDSGVSPKRDKKEKKKGETALTKNKFRSVLKRRPFAPNPTETA